MRCAPWTPLAAVPVAVALTAYLTWACRPRREGFDEPPTIFVSVASYRDADCVNTLTSMFQNADHPRRVFAGVCEQNTASAAEVCLPAGFEWHDQVRRVSLPAREAKGPTYARYLCSTLYRGETYFCQLDSHMRFVKGWDTAAIAMLRACPDPRRAVLSHYPHDWQHTASGVADVPVLCKSRFDDQGVVTFEAKTLPASAAPRPVPFVAGGFMFGPGSLVRDVPFDPDLPHLFQGEEVLYSARLWTAGYDMFTPTANLVFHYYYRKDSPKFWDDDKAYAAEQKKTVAKVRKLLRGELRGYAHGMGTARSLSAYWRHAGVDWESKTTSTEAKFCGS